MGGALASPMPNGARAQGVERASNPGHAGHTVAMVPGTGGVQQKLQPPARAKAVSEQGARLNIKKATLIHWRSEFARNLRLLVNRQRILTRNLRIK